MIELFDALSVTRETIKDEDRVVYLLVSLLDSYKCVPKLDPEVVIECILHQEKNCKTEVKQAQLGKML